MCPFVPNGNKPIKKDIVEETQQSQPFRESSAQKPLGPNPFSGCRSSTDDEFVVDL